MENIKFMINAGMSLVKDSVKETSKKMREEVFQPLLATNKATKKCIQAIYESNLEVSANLKYNSV